MALVLDSGALIAIDRHDRAMIARLVAAHEDGEAVRTSTAAVAQVWRGGARQVTLARVLQGVEEIALDGDQSRAIGALLAKTSQRDVVDAAVALVARSADEILTSDPKDIKALVKGRGVRVSLV